MAICEVEYCDSYAARDVCKKHQNDVRRGRLEPQPHWRVRPNPPCHVEECARLSVTKKAKTPTCASHLAYIQEGRPLETVRPKRMNGSPKSPCIIDGCDRDGLAKGLCSSHYAKSTREYRFPKCAEQGCEKRTPKGLCPDHRPPRSVRVQVTRECPVYGCGKEYRTYDSLMCRNHMSDCSRKKLSFEEYLYLYSISSCQSCGSSERMVTDHHHDHHPDQRRMCRGCIRGRLCSDCNSALGLLKESEERLLGLIQYLKTNTPGSVFA